MFRYYGTQRPITPGSFPKNKNLIEIQNFDTKTVVPEIGCAAYGFIDYSEPLTEKEVADYELRKEV